MGTKVGDYSQLLITRITDCMTFITDRWIGGLAGGVKGTGRVEGAEEQGGGEE